ncbi:MAG TPA: cupin-like domain-containing protein [Polyangiales bacterium]|nr:cupin-like domain-containing protein [Polyangiales bacterium]
MNSVARIRYPELNGFYRNHYATNEPAVLVGVPEHHPLEIFRFSPEYLDRALGGREFPVVSTDTGFLSYERDSVKMSFHDFIEATFQGDAGWPKYYFKNSTKLLPAHLDDSADISGLAPFFTKSVMKNLWISRGSLTVGLHFDAAENLNIQIRGRKRFMLYPPGVTGYYPCPMFSQTAHISRVFREGPELDRSKYPRFDESKGREVILGEGEILYLPAYWWHQVTSLGDVNINLNTWSIPAITKQVWNWNQALRGHYQVLARLIAFGDLTKAPAQTQRQS